MTNIFLNYPVVDPEGPEHHEAVYRENNVQTWEGGGTAYLILLGYLVQIWSRVMHRAWAGRRAIKQNVTNEFRFSAPEDVSQGDYKEWRVSNVMIEITSFPSGGDINFGAPNQIYAGTFAWFRNSIDQDGLDWQLQQGGGFGFQTTGLIGINLQDPYPALPPAQQYFVESPFGQVFTPFTIEQPAPQIFVTGSAGFSIGGKRSNSKAIKATVSNFKDWIYPIQWVNWESCWFEAPDPNVNGFILKLKPGVVANLNIGLTTRDPEVFYGGGEGGSARFNPMKGGAS